MSIFRPAMIVRGVVVMKAIAVAVAAAALPLFATGASAETGAAGAQLGRTTADCAVEQDHWHVAALLRTLPGSDDEERAAKRVASIYAICGAQLAISPYSQGLYNGRAALAAAFAERQLEKRSPALPGGTLTPWYSAAIAGRNYGYDKTTLGFQQLGTCVVAAAGDASARLIRSAAGSTEEREAVAAIRPVLSGCIVQGDPIHMTFDQLRLIVAEPLYHVIVDGRSAGRS